MKRRLWLLLVSASLLPLCAQAHDKRIISAGFGITELIYALNAQNQLIAADFTSRTLIADDHNIKQIGMHMQLPSEGIMSLDATHLIGNDEMGPKPVLELIEQSGVEVVHMPSGQSVESLLARIDALATVVARPQAAAALQQRVSQGVAQLSVAQCDTRPRAIFLMLDGSSVTRVAGRDTAMDTILNLAGAQNPAAANIQGYKAANMEAMLAMQPDYILLAQRAWDQLQSVDNLLAQFPLLRATPAGVHRRIVVIPSGALLGGFGLSSLELAQSLHPQFCRPSR